MHANLLNFVLQPWHKNWAYFTWFSPYLVLLHLPLLVPKEEKVESSGQCWRGQGGGLQ